MMLQALQTHAFIEKLQPFDDGSQLLRLGRFEDGGYVVTQKMLQESTAVFGYGVGWDVSFEVNYIELTQKPAFVFDHTVTRLPKKHAQVPNLILTSEGLSTAKAPRMDTLKAHLDWFGYSSKSVLLKMDIEGGEYPILTSMNRADLSNVSGLIVEFHQLKNPENRAKILQILHLFEQDFYVAHVHGNNYGCLFELESGLFPNTIEVTFARRGSVQKSQKNYPIKDLDYPNNPRKPDYNLPF